MLESMEKRTINLMKTFENLFLTTNRTEESGIWLLGLKYPTALDAHLIVFIARMIDVGRARLIPDLLIRYAQKAMNEPEWTKVMDGRKTISQ